MFVHLKVFFWVKWEQPWALCYMNGTNETCYDHVSPQLNQNNCPRWSAQCFHSYISDTNSIENCIWYTSYHVCPQKCSLRRPYSINIKSMLGCSDQQNNSPYDTRNWYSTYRQANQRQEIASMKVQLADSRSIANGLAHISWTLS